MRHSDGGELLSRRDRREAVVVKQQQFVGRGALRWETFALQVQQLEGFRARRQTQEHDGFVNGYRAICRDLALATERGYSTELVTRLNDLALRGHNLLYVRRTGFTAALRDFFLREFPQLVRREWRYVLAATVLLVAPALLVAAALLRDADAVYYVLSPMEVHEVESMYAPGLHVIGEARKASSDFMMFGYYIMNNIGIGFRTFASGIVLGLGPIVSLSYNGIQIGAVATHLASHGYSRTFFPFVAGHGAFELTAIVLSGAAGLKLGMALINPGRHRRGDALIIAGRSAIRIVFGVFLMLLIAAFIEGFWSSRALVPAWTKYLVAAVLWTFVLGYFTFAARGRGALDDD